MNFLVYADLPFFRLVVLSIFLYFRVKSDFKTYVKKKKQISGGPPPTPPKPDPVLKAVWSLVKIEIVFSEYQYDSTCTEVPTPPPLSAASPYPDTCVTFQEGDYGKKALKQNLLSFLASSAPVARALNAYNSCSIILALFFYLYFSPLHINKWNFFQIVPFLNRERENFLCTY